MVLALVLGAALALLRLSQTGAAPLVRGGVRRVLPRRARCILLIFFSFFGLRELRHRHHRRSGPWCWRWPSTTAPSSARSSGPASARSTAGQTEAAYAIGLGYWQAMLLVVIPQAVRRMVPAIVSQLVTLLKDTSLGFVITYEELLRRSRSTGEFFQQPAAGHRGRRRHVHRS